MLILYTLVLIILSIYSYALVDPNLTLLSHPSWVGFREIMVQFGYYNREYSWYLYLTLVIILFVFHFYYIKKFKTNSVVKISFIIGIICIASYPLLSHDLFNYIFDAKIFTYYGKNPYLSKPADFPSDDWLRFMHWTHRTYPYGPSYLLLSFIPSFLGSGKFILHFILFKSLNVLFYILGIYFLSKYHKKAAMIFATHPLVIVEGLINSHNDLIGVAFAFIGLYYLEKEKQWLGRFILLLSAGIKYITFPILAIDKKNKLFIVAPFLLQIAILFYLSVFNEIQPWYYLSLLVYLPFFTEIIQSWNIFLFGLLVSYYPYIMLGGWDTKEKVELKHYIILSFFIVNIIYILVRKRKIYFEELNIFKK